MITRIFLAFLLVGASHAAEAKVFDYSKSSFIAYLRGAFGINKAQKFAFEPGFAANITFPDHYGVNQNYNAEFGLGFSVGKMQTRAGVELKYPQLVKDLNGVNGATTVMTITSEVYGIIPKLSIEYSIKQSSTMRIYFGVGAGYGATVIKNTVTLNSAGVALYPTASQTYIEEATGYAIMGEAFTGIDIAAFDNTSFSFDVGYNYHPITAFTINRNANTTRGAISVGGTLTNAAGGNRTLDLSGYFASATLRIHIR
ncbi:MAG: hypothetical protein IPM57_09175 [Oligoflexia bacterium]|nr:hypothetical protein [Oligoflexia bacterium]